MSNKKLIFVKGRFDESNLSQNIRITMATMSFNNQNTPIDVLDFTKESPEDVAENVIKATGGETSLVIFGGYNTDKIKSDGDKILAINGGNLYDSIFNSIQADNKHIDFEKSDNTMIAQIMFEGAIKNVFEKMKD